MTKDIVFGAQGIEINFYENYHGTGSKGWCVNIDGSGAAKFQPTLMDALIEAVDNYKQRDPEYQTLHTKPKETEQYYIVVKFSENSYDIVKNIDITRIIYTIHLSEAKYFSDLGEAMEFAEKYISLPYGYIEIRKKSDTRLAAMHSGQWNRY